MRELFDHAELDVSASIALREALESTGGTTYAIGRLLRRGADIAIGGYRISESGSSSDGMLRTVVAVTRKTHTVD